MGESNLTTLSIALNSVHFVPTNLSFAYYVQPTNISSLTPTGGTLSGGTSITVRGEGFAAFSTDASKVRCRWGEDTNGTLLPDVAAANGSYHDTVATQLDASYLDEDPASPFFGLVYDRIVCASHPKANPGT